MIDEYWTWQFYGYYSYDLKPHSNKPIVARCDECCQYRVIRKKQYRELCMPCSKTGKKIQPFTKEHREKISESLKGRIFTDEHKHNISVGAKNRAPWSDEARVNASMRCTKERNPNWKGGITEWRTQLYQSHPYKAWRKAVFERDGYTCQMCGNDIGGNLQAHHIQPVRDNKNTLLILDVDNGITLCKKCHRSISGCEHVFADSFVSIISGRT